MTVYTGNINNLLQGVSQQPRRDRRPEQLEVQENCLSSISYGTRKRPGSVYPPQTINIQNFGTAQKHTYDRGSGNERYTLVAGNGTLDVVDLVTGTERTVTGDLTYLMDQSGENKDPKEYLKFFTIADTTFVVNSTIDVVMDKYSSDPGWQCCIYLAAAKYGKDYIVYADETEIASLTTPATITLDPATETDKTTELKASDTMLTLAEGAGSVAAGGPVQIPLYHRESFDFSCALDVYDGWEVGQKVSLTHEIGGNTPDTIYQIESVWEDGDRVNMIFETMEAAIVYGSVEGETAVMSIRPYSGQIEVYAEDATTFSAAASTVSTFSVGEQVMISNAIPIGKPGYIYKMGVQTVVGDTATFSVTTLGDNPVVLRPDTPALMTILDPAFTGAGADSIRWWAIQNGIDMYTALDASVVVLQSSAAHTIETSDDNNGNDLRVISTTFGSYDKLPSQCLHGFKVKILGEDVEIANDYYVQFERTDSATGVGRGVWRECAGFSELIGFNDSTMPHKITSEADGTFTVEEIAWESKQAGDEESNPNPSFVGYPITSMGLYQDRFVFLTEENCVASRTSHHFNMFSESVLLTSDADPIDTSSSDNNITNLEHLIIFNSSLLIMSDKAQFMHPGDKAFIADKFALASKSQYTANVTAPPVASATSVFFTTAFGNYTGVREFKTNELTGVLQAESITQHVQEYIPGNAEQIVVASDHNIILVRTLEDAAAVYIYEWYDQDSTRKQAAWHVWRFPANIQYMATIGSTLYLWHSTAAGSAVFTTVDLGVRNTPKIDFALRLDLCSQVQAVANGTDWEVFRNLGVLASSWDDVVVTGGLNSGIEGAAATWSANATNTGVLIPKAAVPNAIGTPWFYLGRKYTSVLTITNPFVKDSQGRPKTSSKTTLKAINFNLAATGYLKATVEKPDVPDYVQEYTSKIIQGAYLLNSAAPLEDGTLHIPIRTDAERCKITLSSDSHLPFNVLDVDWAGIYKDRGRVTL